MALFVAGDGLPMDVDHLCEIAHIDPREFARLAQTISEGEFRDAAVRCGRCAAIGVRDRGMVAGSHVSILRQKTRDVAHSTNAGRIVIVGDARP